MSKKLGLNILKTFPLLEKLLFIFLAIILITLVIFPRATELISGNYLFVLDQGRDYMAVHEIVTQKKLTLIGSEIGGGYAGIQGIFQGPYHYYILSIFYILFNGDPYGGIVYMFLFGIGTIIVSFWVARKFFGTFFAFFLSILIAASPPLISQSRFVWNPYPISFFLLLVFYFLYKLPENRKKYFFLAGLSAAFTYSFEIAITVPLFIALLFHLIFILRVKTFKNYISFLSGTILGFLPFILFETRHGFMAVNGFLKYISTHDTDKKYTLINNHLDSFVINLWDTFPHQNIMTGYLFVGILLGLTIFFLVKEKNKSLKNLFIFFLILISSTIFVLSFLRNHIFMYYLYHLNLVYVFLFIYIFYSAFARKKFLLAGFIGVFFVFLIFLGVKDGIQTLLKDKNDNLVAVKMQAKKEAADYIYKDANGKKFGLLIFTPSVVTPHYDYVFIWYGQQKYGYLPHNEKKGLFYLLMEEDPHQPWSYKGWMETVVKTGDILETKKLPSGLIIQKRCESPCSI